MKKYICHALDCDNEADETFFHCEEHQGTICGDHLVPVTECYCLR